MLRTAIGIGIVGALFFASASPASAQLPDSAGLVVDSVTITGGVLGSNPLVAGTLNSLVGTQIADGSLRTLLEVRDLQDPTAQNDPAVEAAVYVGVDLDADPLDDFSGSEEFDIDPASLDAQGNPLALFDMGSIALGHLIAGPSTLDIGLGAPLQGVVLEGDFTLNAASFASDPLDGAVPQVVLQGIPAPFPLTGSVADVLTGFGILPDLDLDNDTVLDAYSVTFTVTAVSCIILHAIGDPVFQRGDANGDGNADLGDAIFILAELFSGGASGPCAAGGDVNDDGTKNVADPIALLGHLFSGEPAPPPPFGACDIDPTPDALTCDASPACP